MIDQLQNFVDGAWRPSAAEQTLDVLDPASTKVLAKVPLSPAAEVNDAVAAAEKAFVGWRRTPVGDRILPLFKLRALLDANRDDIAMAITE